MIVAVVPLASPVKTRLADAVAPGASMVGPSDRNGWPSAVPSGLAKAALVTLATSTFGFWKYCVVLFLTLSATVSVVPLRLACVPVRSRLSGEVAIASVVPNVSVAVRLPTGTAAVAATGVL